MTVIRTETNKVEEWKALVYLCKLGLTDQSIHAPKGLDLQNVNWEGILNLARKHKVRPIISKGAGTLEASEKVPDDIVERLREYQEERGRENILNTRELIQLIRTFREKGVEVVPYKGVVLAQAAYNDIGLREMSDIDFLIDLADFPVIKEVLLNRAYVPSKKVPEEFESIFFKQNFEYNFDLYVDNERKFHVEPHWKIGFRRWQTDLDFEDIKPLSKRRDFFGTEVHMLTPEGFLLTTCLHHGGEDRWSRLKFICDVAAVLFKFEKDMDWEFLLKECDRFKVTNIVLLGIGAAVSTFDAPVNGEVRELIAKRKIASLVMRVNHQLEFGEHTANINTYLKDIRFHLLIRKNFVTKLKVIYYHFIQIFTPTIYDINDEKSAGKKYWWLFVTRPFRIWRTHVKTK